MSGDDAMEARVAHLEDLVHELTVAVQYSPEEPYAAELARCHITGDRRLQIQMVIAGVLDRAEGHEVLLSRVVDLPPAVVAQLRSTAPLDRAGAVAILAQVCGQPTAERLLEAHRQRGLGLSGHAALDAAPPA